MGTLYQSDPTLRALDEESLPAEFLRLSDDEQSWRGRLFMAIFWMSHDIAYSWSGALTEDPDYVGEWRKIVEDTPDALLLARYRAAAAEIAVETGQGLGPVQ